MHVATRPARSARSARSPFIPSPFARPANPDEKFEREPSDMAKELLARVIEGLSRVMVLSARDEQILFHTLYGRSAALTGEHLGLRETTVHKHMHRIYARTRTPSRRALLTLGRELADARIEQPRRAA